jgi:hypothetical protein
MKYDSLKKRKELVSLVLLGLSAALAMTIVVRIAGFFVDSARAEKLIESAAVTTKSDPNDKERYFAKSKEVAQELKKKNLFAPPERKKNPVSGVSAIVTGWARINNKWYKVGDKIGDAQVMEVKGMSVKIKWEGEEKTFSVWDFKSHEEPKREKKKEVAKKPERERKDEKPGAAAEERPEARRPGPGRRDFGELSEEERQRMRERMRERRKRRGSRQGRRGRGSREGRRRRGSREGRERGE